MNDYQQKKKMCYEYIRENAGGNKNPPVKLLKGGSYKIKGYYLENNNLNDIRGASVNLSYVEDVVIPEKIKERFPEACIIYNGGGNIFCILPADVEEDFPIVLENEARKYLVSANTAYVMMDSTLNEVDNDYKMTMYKLEQKLAERKKLKVELEADPKSVFAEDGYIPWSDEDKGRILLDVSDFTGKAVCKLCRSKLARYKNGENVVCASCLHKHSIGQNVRNVKYMQEYKKYTNDEAISCNTLSDIDEDYIAVVYGDGNNMGQIIQNFNDITDMMKFSDDVKATANKAVFTSMKELGIKKFQVVGLGGDDVFVIVSGKVAVPFAVKLIEEYNKAFERKVNGETEYMSTMSVGVCIAKTNTPIRVVLEIAEEKLALAKEKAKADAKKNGCDTGSIAYAIMDSASDFSGDDRNKFGCSATLQPYDYEAAVQIIKLVKELSSAQHKTRIRNLYDAYCNADAIEEAELFFNYQNAKSKAKIILPEINGYTLENSIYKNDDKEAFIWKDILDLCNFIGGKEKCGNEGSV